MVMRKKDGTRKAVYREVSFSYKRLRGRIVEKFTSQARFAKAMGMSSQMVCARLTGRSTFTPGEIWYACELLGIKDEAIGYYFFHIEEKEDGHDG